MSEDFDNYPPQIEYQGDYRRGIKNLLYEKTTDDIEIVTGLIAAKGTEDYQAKICGAADTPIGVFKTQAIHQPMVSGKPSSHHAEDGESCEVDELAEMVWLQLTASQTITKGMYLEVIAGGLVQEESEGTRVARAAESVSTGVGEKAWIRAYLLINKI